MRSLNFARVPFRNERLPMLGFGLAVAVLIAVTLVHGVVLTRYLLREQEELDAKVDVLQKEHADLETQILRTENELQSQRNEARTERIRFLAALYRQKSFSWTGLFNELETLTPAQVRITSIAPAEIGDLEDEYEQGIEVKLEVIARGPEDVLEMVRRLEANRLLANVLPIRESEGGERAAGGVAASLTLRYLHLEEDVSSEEASSESAEPAAGEKAPPQGNEAGSSPVSRDEDPDSVPGPESKPVRPEGS